MKLLELEIHEMRGIRELCLKPEGKNVVVWGPNGSGKSAVVDAIDFLFTGHVSRLMGKGTGGITLSRHGPHIDHTPDEAIVRAMIELPKTGKRIELARNMASPGTLEINGPKDASLDGVLGVAQRGQNVLTRREILRYITAERGTRAEQIQELLDLNAVEEIRRALVRVENDFRSAVASRQSQVVTAQGAIGATIQAKEYRPDAVLAFVNRCRSVLGGEPVEKFDTDAIKRSLLPPSTSLRAGSINSTLLANDIANLAIDLSSENQAYLQSVNKELVSLLHELRTNEKLMRDFDHMELTREGLDLLDESDTCPLCDTPWPPGELRSYLEQKLSSGELAAQYDVKITKLANALTLSAARIRESVTRVLAVVRTAGLEKHERCLNDWLAELSGLITSLESPVQNYSSSEAAAEETVARLAPSSMSEVLLEIEQTISTRYPNLPPEQTAWDSLTSLQENLKWLRTAELQLVQTQRMYEQASILAKSYGSARDVVLNRLYSRIKNRFVQLYRELHGSDEDTFEAKLEPDGVLEVDFHGHGTHPPHALHSEGHQDSMGLCLYLALAEQLGQGQIQLIVLDDVVMSVDTDHRRSLCALLSRNFPNIQFVITTHDKTWATQLKMEGIVRSREYAEFYQWHLDTGPLVNCAADLWEKIEYDLQRSDVPGAAARLRRGSEEFFAEVCDALQASVKFKLTGRWELGDFLPGALGQYGILLRQAKKAAQSWGDQDLLEMLQELDSTRSSIAVRSQAEQWAVNASVHYNNWADLQKSDFRPLVEAFQDLFGMFKCTRCGSVLRVFNEGSDPAVVKCSCGKVNWNLTEKKKKSG